MARVQGAGFYRHLPLRLRTGCFPVRTEFRRQHLCKLSPFVKLGHFSTSRHCCAVNWSQANVPVQPWKAAGTLAPLILGLLVFFGSFVYDFTVAKDPLFPWYLFKSFRNFSSLLMLVFVAGMVFFAASALNAQTILYLHTADPIKLGVYSIPSG